MSGGLGGRRRLRSPVGGLGLGGPVVGNLESGGSSCRGSGSRSSCRSAVSRPVGHRGGGTSKLLASPLFLGRRSNEVGLLAGDHLLSPGCLLLLGLLGVAVEEEVGHHLPWHVARDRTAQPQNFPGKEPPHEADALGALVVAGHSDVNELGGRVDIGERNNGDVGEEATEVDVRIRFGFHYRVDLKAGVVREGYAILDLPDAFNQMGIDLYGRCTEPWALK